MYVHIYYEFISASKEEKYGATLRKHAGSLLFGLLKDKGSLVWESEEGCKEILNWSLEDQPNASGATLKIINYNIREMNKALKEIQRLKEQ